jgi:hypothetical protein
MAISWQDNARMEAYDEFEPVMMASDVEWRRCLYRAGRPCKVCKGYGV